MQYSEALDYLYSRLPVYHRIGPKAIKPGLTNTLRLCAALGDPQHKFKSIHVGGTNGKGSTAHMLAAVYQAAGYRVGLYTSPHLRSFTERIRINGQPIDEEDVADFVTSQQALIESIEPSFFEVTVALAFLYFAFQEVDVAVIEVGLGGRLDSTNVITPAASVITNIGFDHMDILGDTLPAIAAEKAGIIKAGIPVIIGETHPETEPVFRAKATQEAAPITFADQQVRVQDRGLLRGFRQVLVSQAGESDSLFELGLTGGYQRHNLAAVLATVEMLQPIWPVSKEALQRGVREVVTLTGLKGRFQLLSDEPRVYVDTAHNKPGLEALMETVASLSFDTLRIVMGVVADKAASSLLLTLPSSAVYYFCQASSPRSLPALLLQAEAAEVARFGEVYSDVNVALDAARQDAQGNDVILITGSNYVVAELINL
ncbi:bifunctional folylpolyglutamate synthase/dihydrofolate synthase [Spirosoma sordidisoli]|uniref:Dihydrofolate synthase/folylpolyglutamate synthase n=1 Tax=Spirosoma sordidisoli TaxID=2502893 RepID=A0A4Q2UJU0_9BACT|nr:folylpolyglutamate synthase/dihydrofolate synthase family protein [Spirosoma sordidisoli]RYC69514.1 bifunctional folylpolyglutamate synthase/dihydrofolate synthase [Spirosoma sordidisoli]